MINELYDLSQALNSARIQTQSWHRKYIPIPNITRKAPCVCITISDGKVVGISQVNAAFQHILRKYGSNQGSYPCMNLAPLYRLTDETAKKELEDIREHPEHIDDACIGKMKAWCTENNWGRKFQAKYKISMESIPAELRPVAARYQPLQILMDETNRFANASDLHAELERTVWELLEQGKHTQLALAVLFYQGKTDKSREDDYGSLSAAFDSVKLLEGGMSAVSEQFVRSFNRHLLDIYDERHAEGINDSVDAFGIPFHSIEEPLPKVKLAGGFDVTLRTMFGEQRCQTRYGKIENDSYPISPRMRMELQAALEWVGGSPEQKDKTWAKIDRNEILFVYPHSLRKVPNSCIAPFKQIGSGAIPFSTAAKQFTQELLQTKEPGTDTHARGIRIFVLRKIDKGRGKIVYTGQTDPYELEKYSEEWTLGCANLPAFPFGTPDALYPLDVADVLNRFWKRNGEIVTDKVKLLPRYHGIELLLDPSLSVVGDLHRLSESAMTIGAFFGDLRAKHDLRHPKWGKAKDMLALMGLFLYREHIRKDDYMDSLPYTYGQLLKAVDELHALYCSVVRNRDVPPQLAGSSLFQSAAEAPIHTMNVLSQRMMPYYSWAKSYRLKGITEKGKESWRAGWLYRLLEKTMERLQNNWTPQTRFSDEEKVQLFIGYLAEFPKETQNEANPEEESTHE